MSQLQLPAVIGEYQAAHDRRDVDSAIECFGPDASVADDGRAYVGRHEIRGWLANAASEYTYTRTLTGIDDLGDGAYLVRQHLSGNFPGGEVDLRYRFDLRDRLIHRLEIAP